MSTIGVFFGGRSPEHDISIITGQLVISELRKMGHAVVPVYVDRNGIWRTSEALGELKFFKTADNSDALSRIAPVHPRITGSDTQTLELETRGFFKKRTTIDFVFPAFHGPFGEDGTFQGLLEFLSVPYAGCGVFASALTMDKALTKALFARTGINTTDFITAQSTQWREDPEALLARIEATLTYPVFVKPALGGSSIGISRATTHQHLKDALDVAFSYDARVVVENGVAPLTDLTCAVLETSDGLITSAVQESVLGESGFFDYDKKYLEDGGAQTGNASDNLIIPANIPDTVRDDIWRISKEVFEHVDGGGTLRVDFLYNADTQELYANEINTLPGTLYHHLWEKTDIPLKTVITEMIESGKRRAALRSEIATDHVSGVLSHANSLKLQQKQSA